MVASTLAYWFATLAALAGGLLRGKVAAVFLGTSGVGITAQLTTLSALIGTLATLGIGTGGMKVIAEARGRGDEDVSRRVISLLLWAPFAAGLAALALVAVFARPLSVALLGDGRYALLLVVGMSAIPMNGLLASLQVVMQGYEMAGRLAVNSVVAAVFTTAAAVPLTITFGVHGAVAAAPLSAAATIAFFVVREKWLIRGAFPLTRPGPAVRRELAQLAGASLGASAITLGIDTVLRAYTVHTLNLAANGLYQPVQMFSSVLLAQLAGALSLVLLPRLSFELGRGRTDVVLATLRSAAQSAVVLAVPLCLLTIAFSHVLVLVFFDERFTSVSGVLALQSAAELPRFLLYVIGAVVLPAGYVRAWLASSVLANLVRLVLGLALLPGMGLYGLAVSVVAQWVVELAYVVLVLRRRMGWRSGPRLNTLACAGTAVIAVAVVASFTGPLGKAAVGVGAAAWLGVVGRREAALLGRLLVSFSHRGFARRRVVS